MTLAIYMHHDLRKSGSAAFNIRRLRAFTINTSGKGPPGPFLSSFAHIEMIRRGLLWTSRDLEHKVEKCRPGNKAKERREIVIQKGGSPPVFKLRLLKKYGPSSMKNVTFVGHEFARKRDNKPHLKFHMKKVAFRIYRMMPRMLVFDERITDFGATRTSRRFGT
ncbi:hypothetical protein [Absidia glauca]|uniref:Uncharacterized protein n=1 Tax=Absidia glauca TaxID=4829 RepID=A0A163M406_ABSGL|nr:hypothetical protein [Absidia glauca]